MEIIAASRVMLRPIKFEDVTSLMLTIFVKNYIKNDNGTALVIQITNFVVSIGFCV